MELNMYQVNVIIHAKNKYIIIRLNLKQFKVCVNKSNEGFRVKADTTEA